MPHYRFPAIDGKFTPALISASLKALRDGETKIEASHEITVTTAEKVLRTWSYLSPLSKFNLFMKDKSISTQTAICIELCKFNIPELDQTSQPPKTSPKNVMVYLVFNENRTPIGFIFKEQLLKAQIQSVRMGRKYRYELLKAPVEALAKMPNVYEDMLCPLIH